MKQAIRILILILLLPMLIFPVALAATPSPGGNISQLITQLAGAIVAALVAMAVLAIYRDPGYAFVLLAAALVAAYFFSQYNPDSHGASERFFYTVQLQISGPSNAYVNDSVTYTVKATAPGGVNITNLQYNWSVLYNGTIPYAQGTGQTFTFKPKLAGYYVITVAATGTGNVGVFTVNLIGGGGTMLKVTNPPSGLGFITAAITGFFESIANFIINGIKAAAGQVVGAFAAVGNMIILYGTENPILTGDSPLGGVVNKIYTLVQTVAFPLSFLLLGASIAYNAFRGMYNDLVDLGADVIYKYGVWALFTYGGLTIYNAAAQELNYLITTISADWAAQLGAAFTSSFATYFTAFILGNIIPFGFGSALTQFGVNMLTIISILAAVAILRYIAIAAIVALIPLMATLWLFEWTRGIATVLVDILVGLMLAGVVNAAMLAILFGLNIGALLIFILPVVADTGIIFSLAMALFAVRPHEQIARTAGGLARSSQYSPPPQQSSSSSQPSQPQQSKPKGSPTTYI